MSLKANVQIAVLVSAFRTMGVCEQGDYYCEVRFYIETPIARYYANPVQREGIRESILHLKESRVINRDMIDVIPERSQCRKKYTTQIMRIRYNLEECNMNELVFFTHEIDLPKVETSDDWLSVYIPLNIEVKLFKLETYDEMDIQDYQEVSTKSFRVGDIVEGIFKATPVVFDSPYSCILSTSVFVLIKNISFSARSKMRKEFDQPIFERRDTRRVTYKTSREANKCNIYSMTSFTENDLYDEDPPENFLELLFPDDDEEVSVEDAQNAYEMACNLMIWHFNKMRETYKEFYSHLKPKRKVHLPETPAFIKPKKEFRKDLFIKQEEEPVGKVQEEEEKLSSDKSSTESNSVSIGPRVRIEEEKETTFKDKISEAWDYFTNKVADIFRETRDVVMIPKAKVAKIIEGEIYKLNRDIVKGWEFLIDLSRTHPVYIKRYHENKYWRLYNRVIEEKRMISREIHQLDEIVPTKELDEIAAEMKQLRVDYLQSTGLETARGLIGEKCIYRENNTPIFYEEVLERKGGFKKSATKTMTEKDDKFAEIFEDSIHVVFLIHGFGGKSKDMQKLSNILALRCPKIRPIICKSVEKNADDPKFNIEKLGHELAKEVEDEIVNECQGYDKLKMSFIGHSMGGLVIRYALRHLRKYKDNLETLMTLGTPHCGYMHSKSSLISYGIWVLDKVVANPLLNEIRLGDSKDVKESRLYKLSQSPEIGYFKEILMFGSDQDTFASIETSLIKATARMKKLKKYDSFQEMQDNIQESLLSGKKKKRITLVTVDLQLKHDSLGAYIGRKAHIEFLSNVELAKMIMSRYSYAFDL
ncbi:unnamed protein product [Moneuplotes crassus]|uniref:DUF676 domain-containing protein n=2 Tax=Euplotes crassus TaxID=5936 RepID=A0AAD1Y7B0_EUPCR|nr:unnamed protein product [Moneuplotes crassus]